MAKIYHWKLIDISVAANMRIIKEKNINDSKK